MIYVYIRIMYVYYPLCSRLRTPICIHAYTHTHMYTHTHIHMNIYMHMSMHKGPAKVFQNHAQDTQQKPTKYFVCCFAMHGLEHYHYKHEQNQDKYMHGLDHHQNKHKKYQKNHKNELLTQTKKMPQSPKSIYVYFAAHSILHITDKKNPNRN